MYVEQNIAVLYSGGLTEEIILPLQPCLSQIFNKAKEIPDVICFCFFLSSPSILSINVLSFAVGDITLVTF